MEAEGGNTTSSFGPLPPPPPPRPLTDRPIQVSNGNRFPYGTAIVALLVIAGSVGALIAFGGASVSVTPTTTHVTVSGDFTATAGTGDLPFEVISVENTASQDVPAESTETVNDPAQGTITILNAQAAPQTLIKNTRFETPAGLIFRIHESVSIPGGSVSAPGSVTATAYADMGGDSYNIGATTFTVPGLKGSKAYDLVTAKSTGPMQGGFSGSRASVSQATRDAQNVKNQAALEKSLAEGIKAKIPEGYILVPGGTFIAYSNQPDTAASDNTVTVSQKGTIQAIVFPQGALAKALAFSASGSYSGQPVSIPNVSGLTLTPKTASAPVGEATTTFGLSGETEVVWDIDTARVASAVAGKSRESAKSVLSGFPEIQSALLNLKPFWAQTFPSDPADIKVTVDAPEAQ